MAAVKYEKKEEKDTKEEEYETEDDEELESQSDDFFFSGVFRWSVLSSIASLIVFVVLLFASAYRHPIVAVIFTILGIGFSECPGITILRWAIDVFRWGKESVHRWRFIPAMLVLSLGHLMHLAGLFMMTPFLITGSDHKLDLAMNIKANLSSVAALLPGPFLTLITRVGHLYTALFNIFGMEDYMNWAWSVGPKHVLKTGLVVWLAAWLPIIIGTMLYYKGLKEEEREAEELEEENKRTTWVLLSSDGSDTTVQA